MKNSKIYLFTYFLCSYLFIYYLFHSQSIILTLKIWVLTTTITGTTVMVTLIIKVTIVMIIMITEIRIAITTTQNNSNGSNTTTKNNKNENIDNNDYQNIMRRQQFYIGSTICNKMNWNIKILVFSRSSIYPLSRHGALSAHIKDVRDHVSRWNCIIKKIK